MREPEMAEIAHLVRRALAAPGDDPVRAAVREEVATLCSKFVPYP
jgi:glycine/serine hydroxymethyltransferase